MCSCTRPSRSTASIHRRPSSDPEIRSLQPRSSGARRTRQEASPDPVARSVRERQAATTSACWETVRLARLVDSRPSADRPDPINSRSQRVAASVRPDRPSATSSCLNIGRMLGDKFLKEQEALFGSEPYVSQAVDIPKGSNAFALMAR
ncbi:hypothetical protein ACLOJK_026009 [Asimina triloba]